ncbi:beta family protein [Xanthomonas campestris pv. zingibericola]|uniref:beta family protein n=1 Tax=Xanthomonas euvesicatoria TaxID=456327 RepID=UPI001C445F6A|nr:beta family protein [Xanthomonas euvesicatoria]MBV6857940.1 beta family protein [Xanthomonas campestris pv. zingibericola]
MNILAGKLYSPIIRSRDAELKGFKELSGAVKDALLPIFEFTKSRRSPKNTAGAISICVSSVEKALEDRRYIADVTSMDSLSNAETGKLLDPEKAFRNWRTFVATTLGPSCIPVIHLTDPLDSSSVLRQCEAFFRKGDLVAVRVPSDYSEIEALTEIFEEEMIDLRKIIFICDAGFIRPSTFADVQVDCSVRLGLAHGYGARILAASGFPSSVVLPDYGGDAYGKFRLLEVDLHEKTCVEPGMSEVIYGDYALIHPNDFSGVVTNWVPRVDVPLRNELYYYRYRRHDGGYQRAATEAFADGDYLPLPCWAHDNIKSAAEGNVQGRSPAHWIAARVNYHITRQVDRLLFT